MEGSSFERDSSSDSRSPTGSESLPQKIEDELEVGNANLNGDQGTKGTKETTHEGMVYRPYYGLEQDEQEQQNIKTLARTLTTLSLSSKQSETTAKDVTKGEQKDMNDEIQSGSSKILHEDENFEKKNISIPSMDSWMADARLNPDSPDFDSKFWIQTVHQLFNSDPDYYKPITLGVCLKGLRVSGISAHSDFQSTVSNVPLKIWNYIRSFTSQNESRYFDILKPLDALFEPGRLCVVLGRPGAGCSTLLKTVSARTYGLTVRPESILSYDGISQHDIVKHYRGDVIYSAEVDSHFAQLPVGYTLEFAARCRCPASRPKGVSREQYYKHYAAVVMATYGLSHTYNTKVGDDYIRGVSGGERKRVSIAEVTLAGSKVQCWDNSTRGLDSATALEFVWALKTNAEIMGTTPLIAIYQCSQDAYDLFDDVLLLYEGREIFFGPANSAKSYFEDMGWLCPPRQTTADFLTSITAPSERICKAGFENKVPRTPDEFYSYWLSSPQHAELISRIDAYLRKYENGNAGKDFHEHHASRQSKHLRRSSPFLISFGMQVKAVMDRNWKRIKNDPSVYLFNIIANCGMALIISSMFYNQPSTTSSFYYRTSALFTAVLFNSFSSLLEIISLFEARKIVEKHMTYAFYHPSADALASIITELPSKFFIAVGFNLIYYFLVNLRRTPGHFFFYFLISLTSTFAMSHIFRTIGAACTSLAEAMTPASILLLIISIYVGFIIPESYILGWSKWLYYLNPIARSMEAMVANEFSDRFFECSTFIPSGGSYDAVSTDYKVCSVVGSVAGESEVSGTIYIEEAFSYYNKHRWRDWGIVFSYAVFFLGVYLVLIEYNKGELQKGEIALFPRSTLKQIEKKNKNIKNDIEAYGENNSNFIFDSKEEKSSEDSDVSLKKIGSDSVFFWKNVNYDIQIKTETRRILTNVSGWVKPGTLTALMGSSGAGKTTLLDVLADRVTTGVISGDMLVNGHPRNASFQRSTGYCQQQDLHGRTQTVREALRFSAYLRQPFDVSTKEKNEYVEEIIKLLEMDSYADAFVGTTGEGLNVEQRKRLTIGVELVAKPKLLLFLDEPTSGLDSQTAWSICQLMRKLANHGQAILCTIHQPSAMLMEEFDRLLLLQKGGQTVYFGELGKGCSKMIEYFESKGSQKFPSDCNPAEFMLHVIGAAPGSHALVDYHKIWMESDEYAAVQAELTELGKILYETASKDSDVLDEEFATPFWYQLLLTTDRVMKQHWRSPRYIYSKILMTTFSSIFIGFSFFNADNTQQGLQNQMFSLFILLVIFDPLVQQMLPQYCDQRALYEARERPSKTLSWAAFVLSQLLAELPWCFLTGTIAYFCFYYPVGLYRNCSTTEQLHERGALFWLLCVAFMIFTTTFGQACIAGIERRENAALLANTCFMICLAFCGVLVTKNALPGFWVFMYYLSPFTYLISTMLSTAVGNASVECSDEEYVQFPPPPGYTCGEYMSPYISLAGGYLLDSDSTELCSFCTLSETNVYLASVDIEYSTRWRDWGIFVCYCAFNILGFIFIYWLVRVPRNSRIPSIKYLLKKRGKN